MTKITFNFHIIYFFSLDVNRALWSTMHACKLNLSHAWRTPQTDQQQLVNQLATLIKNHAYYEYLFMHEEKGQTICSIDDGVRVQISIIIKHMLPDFGYNLIYARIHLWERSEDLHSQSNRENEDGATKPPCDAPWSQRYWRHFWWWEELLGKFLRRNLRTIALRRNVKEVLESRMSRNCTSVMSAMPCFNKDSN